MKKLVLTLTALSLASMAALAQGKITFANDSLHLVYYATDGSANPTLAGSAVSSGNMPAGVTLVADLYGGSSSSSLTLLTTTSFGVTAGRFTGVNFAPAGIAAGGTSFFQVQVRDTAHASATLASNDAVAGYYGFSSIFTTTAGSSIAFNSIVNPNSPAFSTFAAGTYDMSTQTSLSGARGVLAISTPIVAAPEPASFALAGLGAAGLMIFRRRNKA